MRRAATIVLTAAMGIHCGAADESDRTRPASDGSEETRVDDEAAAPPHAARSGEAPAPIARPVAPSRAFVALPSLVLTTVIGPDGATYVAGTYAGSIEVGGATFTSTGKDDVFIARRERDGRVSWARSVGSLSAESGPHLTFDDGHLKLVATTRGDVDCGAGPLGKWNSEMFFMCVFDEKGATVGGGSFPTGAK
jgi:hypothetical protein